MMQDFKFAIRQFLKGAGVHDRGRDFEFARHRTNIGNGDGRYLWSGNWLQPLQKKVVKRRVGIFAFARMRDAIRKRKIDLSRNALAWLALYRGKSGPIFNQDSRKCMAKVSADSGRSNRCHRTTGRSSALLEGSA